jgi:hypothetical protein
MFQEGCCGRTGQSSLVLKRIVVRSNPLMKKFIFALGKIVDVDSAVFVGAIDSQQLFFGNRAAPGQFSTVCRLSIHILKSYRREHSAATTDPLAKGK